MIALRNILRHRTRSLLTVLGIALGVAAIVALGALADGLVSGFTAILTSSRADLAITASGSVDLGLSSIDEKVGEELLAVSGVEAVAGLIEMEVSIPGIPYFVMFGYDPNGFAIQRFKITEGKPLSNPKEMILGKLAATNLKKGVGDSLRLYDSLYRIVGIYETGIGLEESGGVISLPDAQIVFKKPHQVGGYMVTLKDTERVDEVQDNIERRFKELTVVRSAEFGDKQYTVQIVQAFAWALSLVAILAGGIVMMNTLLMSVFERTREIGVLRALGWGRRKILAIILSEAWLLSLSGGVVGAILGIVTVKAVARVPALAGILIGKFSLGLFFQVALVTISLGTLGGLYPAWWASRLSPVEALRYEGGGGAAARVPGGMALRNLLRQRVRTILTLVGIGVSVALVVSLAGLTSGFIDSFTQIATGTGTDLMAVEAKVSDLSYSAIDQRVARKLAVFPGVKYVSGVALGFSMVEDSFLIVFGYHPSEFAMAHFKVVEGRGIGGSHEMIMGRTASESLKKGVGDTVRVTGSAYRIVGIFETGSSIEDHGGVISLREAQALFGKPRMVSMLGIKVSDPRRAEETRRNIEEAFPEISISMSSEFAQGLPDMRTMQSLVSVVAILAVIVGGVGMMNTMVMSVFERTREIGVLRALGWKRRAVLGLILRESLLLGAASGLMGIIMGSLMGRALVLVPMLGQYISVNLSPMVITQALIMALILGSMGGMYPSWWASRLSPVEALRYE